MYPGTLTKMRLREVGDTVPVASSAHEKGYRVGLAVFQPQVQEVESEGFPWALQEEGL